MMGLKDQFQNITRIGPEFRPVLFWSWNDDLKLEELTRQLGEIATSGLGGHFMHARTGLITGYMGPQWLQLVKQVVAASRKARVQAWLYDEDCWPSGSAGGVIPAKDPSFTCKALRWQKVPPLQFKPTPQTIATYLINTETKQITPVQPHLAARKLSYPGQVLHFYYTENTSYTDVMNPAAVKEFLNHTYNSYRAAVGAEFGKTVPGIFTDEPEWAAVPGWDAIPWSTELPRHFKKVNGYELASKLPALILQDAESAGFRYDFWKAATELFVDSFSRQAGEWCKKKKLPLTGHYMAEDSLPLQVRFIGAAMPHYPWMDIPGIDQLGRFITNPLLCKQVSSVANQFGKRRVLSEMYGGAGWNVSFEQLKWIAEWQFAQGINLSCTHLGHYSLQGSRKRDYPASLFYQQPWWPDYKRLNDYFGRLAFMLTRGKRTPHVLVLHPIESAWALCGSADSTEIDKINAALVGLATALQGVHVDFDFGDESILAENGRVAGKQLRVKNATYRIVIIPPCVTLRSSTLALIERFRKAGGTVVRIDAAVPKLADGRESERPAEVIGDLEGVKLNAAKIREALGGLPGLDVKITTDDGKDAETILVHPRDNGTEHIFFCANSSATEAVNATIELPPGRLEEWDAETGEIRALATKKSSGRLRAALRFEPMGSHLLVLHRGKKPATVREKKQRVIDQLTLNDSWSVERLDRNALTLDTCSYRIGRGDWSPPTPVLTVQDNLQHLAGSEVCEFKYVFEASFSSKLPQGLHLIVEDPEAYEISMNGFPVARQEGRGDSGWWRDVSFRRLDISTLLKPQDRNEIVLRRLITVEVDRKRQMAAPGLPADQKNRLRYAGQIESIYIIGDFLVRTAAPWESLDRRALRTAGPFVLTDMWSQMKTGDLVSQGYPFYAGRVRLAQSVTLTEKQVRAMNGARLELDPPDAITMNVLVNGRHAGFRAWRPYAVEIGEFLTSGRNEIKIELAGSCRNLLGPHHHTDGELHFVSPGSFRGTKSWTDRPDAPEQVWTDSYSFVRFGLAGPASLILWK